MYIEETVSQTAAISKIINFRGIANSRGQKKAVRTEKELFQMPTSQEALWELGGQIIGFTRRMYEVGMAKREVKELSSDEVNMMNLLRSLPEELQEHLRLYVGGYAIAAFEAGMMRGGVRS